MLSLSESNYAQLLAMRQAIGAIISLLPEDKKEQAKSIIQVLSVLDYADNVSNIPTLTNEKCDEMCKKVNDTYLGILSSIETFEMKNE
ncbi:hypothetical protein [Morganella morganii]|uniref:hypothetical protein n=1 Tax=Morganella morganii TaxID=582 RepID=UPI00223175EA|nr:hypothetical protein [Morganella morganii]MDM8752011.1 hypothetical protein [Morganella morganii]